MVQQRWLDRLLWAARVSVGVVSGLISYLAFFRPPTALLWFVRLGVTEWGYWLVPFALAPLLGPWRRLLGWAAWLLSAAALVAQLPLLEALLVARTLPARLDAAFGDSARAEHAPPAVPLALQKMLPQKAPEAVYTRLVYAVRDDKSLHLDLYAPHKAEVRPPLVVVIHGGAWRSGDSQQLAALNHQLVARGYAVASLTYRLAPHHQFPAAYDDVRDALLYLATNASDLGIDANRVALLGRSAGAQLALLAAYRLENPAIRGVVSFYGPTDLHWGYDHPANPAVIDTHAVLEDYLGGTPADVPDAYTAASPIAFVGAETPPTLLIHGGKDEMVFLANSERLVAKLAEANRPQLLVHLPWAAHACDANLYGPSGQLSTYAITRFLATVL